MHSHRPITSNPTSVTILGTMSYLSMTPISKLLAQKLSIHDEYLLHNFPNKIIVVLYMYCDSEFKKTIELNVTLKNIYKKGFELPVYKNIDQLISSHFACILLLHYYNELSTDLQQKCLAYLLNYGDHISKQKYDSICYSKEHLINEFIKHDTIITHPDSKELFMSCNKYAYMLSKKYGRNYCQYKYTVYPTQNHEMSEEYLLELLRNTLIELKNVLINKISHACQLMNYTDLVGLNNSCSEMIYDKMIYYKDVPGFTVSKNEFDELKYELIWLSENYAF